MKHLVFLSLGLFVVGCGSTQYKAENNIRYICVDGVEYMIMGHGRRGYMAPHFKTDGTLYLCDKKPARFEHN